MIGRSVQNAFGPVELLQQKNAGQFVGQGHVRQADGQFCAMSNTGVQPPSPTYDKTGTTPFFSVGLAKEFRQLQRGETLAMFVQHKRDVLRGKSFQNPLAFKMDSLRWRKGGVTVTNIGHVQPSPV